MPPVLANELDLPLLGLGGDANVVVVAGAARTEADVVGVAVVVGRCAHALGHLERATRPEEHDQYDVRVF